MHAHFSARLLSAYLTSLFDKTARIFNLRHFVEFCSFMLLVVVRVVIAAELTMPTQTPEMPEFNVPPLQASLSLSLYLCM